MKPFLVALVSLLGGSQCGTSSPASTPAAAVTPAAESFVLHPGEKASAAGGDLVVTFVEVLEDSRCPKGDQCIHAGRARLSFEAARRGGETVRFVLDSSRESADTAIPGFDVTLSSVEPYPVSGRPNSSQDYLAKITIRPL